MYESRSDLAELQGLLDRSIAGAGAHLRSIIEPVKRTLTAAQLVEALTGMTTLALATVTAAGEPRVSAAHRVGDDLGVCVHGHARFLDIDTAENFWIEDHLVAHYGSSPRSWGPDIVYLRIEPTWTVAYAPDPAALTRPGTGDAGLP